MARPETAMLHLDPLYVRNVVNICPVIIVERPHPFPFRTRKLSSLTPMVLPYGGRVGRRRAFFLCPGIYVVAPPFVMLDVHIARLRNPNGDAPSIFLRHKKKALWMNSGAATLSRPPSPRLTYHQYARLVEGGPLRVSAPRLKKSRLYEGRVPAAAFVARTIPDDSGARNLGEKRIQSGVSQLKLGRDVGI